MHRFTIDRGKRLSEAPHTGHNRFHPDLEPILEVRPEEEVVLETRDALDGQLSADSTVEDFTSLDTGAVHPLTGPVHVAGAEPGDVLEVEFLAIEPAERGFSVILPNLGFLRDLFTTPYLVHWDLTDGYATSPQIPGVRLPGAPFMGISATAPSADALAAWTAREGRLIDRAAERKWRQFRREAIDRRRSSVAARFRRRRTVLDWRRAFRAGRRRGLRYGGRNGGDGGGALPSSQRVGGATGTDRADVQPRGLSAGYGRHRRHTTGRWGYGISD